MYYYFLLKKSTSLKTEAKEVDVIVLEPEIIDNEPLPSGWWDSYIPEDYRTNLEYGPKLKIMLSIIEHCERIGDKVLVFSSSLCELDAIEHFLKLSRTRDMRHWEKNKDYYRMDGTVPPESRKNLCDMFNRDNDSARYQKIL